MANAPLQTLEVDADANNGAMIARHQNLVVVANRLPKRKDIIQRKLYSTELRYESQRCNVNNERSPPNSGGGREQ
jgi:hypothetical protein